MPNHKIIRQDLMFLACYQTDLNIFSQSVILVSVKSMTVKEYRYL